MIDANKNRVKEGLRVLEDICRFHLKHDTLFREFRKVRHAILSEAPTRADSISFRENNIRQGLIAIVQANCHRVQEGLRVLEELDGGPYKKLRYKVYDLHRDLFFLVKRKGLKGVCAIYDPDQVPLGPEVAVSQFMQNNFDIFQLRAKSHSKKATWKLAKTIKREIPEEKVFIINDHLDVAIDLADGVHLGLDDFPIEQAVRMGPPGFIVGATVHTLAEAKFAELAGATYLSVGCLFPTASKKDTIPTTLDTFQEIVDHASIPVAGVGGMDENKGENVLDRGAHFFVMLSKAWE